MSAPLGKREMIAWTICGVLAVVAAIGYSKRTPEPPAPATVPPTTLETPPVTPPATLEATQSVTLPPQPAAAPRSTQQTRPPQDTIFDGVGPTVSPPLVKTEPNPDSARVRIGSRTPQATLYVNDESRGELSRFRSVVVPVGRVRLSVRAPGCTPWDSTITTAGGSEIAIGFRMARC